MTSVPSVPLKTVTVKNEISVSSNHTFRGNGFPRISVSLDGGYSTPWRCRPPQRGARVQYPVSSGEAKSQQRSFHGEHCFCSVYGIIQHRDQQRLAGTPFFICRSLGTCQRAISSIIRTKMLLSGDVEENPGPSLRGMQWNCAGLSQGKRLALHKTLVDERIAFCLLSETRMTPGEAACFSVAGYLASLHFASKWVARRNE
ncbi:hypothetical protein, unlikely [Trypanosoma brucei gambiense DAL972]|uniref:T. brucei spp.-specific protein n=1 Tax=Trypanosoma brucei gambiense (strain MHOM/CI/86/DAL972) TaxID=679716 RepID=D0A1R5_TRYB9|nr:hypothetical protein, unlikely [Trypanosoma brucei gambiense DAL972]CBH15208.1 hypothetical protein, unlikely [Trypanosoma brucei gambiense DAL972]|eukprot:XP_011777473.1 hypothetical protein, unlikely [Trypanosoma brucei gambiense DAL972]